VEAMIAMTVTAICTPDIPDMDILTEKIIIVMAMLMNVVLPLVIVTAMILGMVALLIHQIVLAPQSVIIGILLRARRLVRVQQEEYIVPLWRGSV